MPRYTFELQDGERPIGDDAGVWLANRDEALDHATGVARELMKGREGETRAWRLDVYEDGVRVCQIPFASVDPALDSLAPHLRATVQASCESIRSFRPVASTAHDTERESRGRVAPARGKPYLATDHGEPTTRPLTGESKEPSERAHTEGNKEIE